MCNLKWILVIHGWGISCEIALIWMSLNFTDDQSTLVQVMAWCRQATSHNLRQCWPRSRSPYGVTRPQWVKQQAIIWAIFYLYRFCDMASLWDNELTNTITDHMDTYKIFIRPPLPHWAPFANGLVDITCHNNDIFGWKVYMYIEKYVCCDGVNWYHYQWEFICLLYGNETTMSYLKNNKSTH